MDESSSDDGFSEISRFSSENYSDELDRVLEQYEEAAKSEQYYLLQFSFHLPHSYYTIECGLSPARSFSPVIRLQVSAQKITFTSYEWTTFIGVLEKLQEEFFKNPSTDADSYPITCGDFRNITLTRFIYDNDIKQVMVMKQLSWLYLSENDVKQILDINSSLISHRLTLLENLNFCMYYYDVLNSIRLMNSDDVSIIELFYNYCNSENNILLANALRDYIYYYLNKDI